MRTSIASVVVVIAAFAGLVACASAPTRSSAPSGSIEFVLRRIDVVEASYDAMKVNIVVAVENGTGSDLDVAASLDAAIVGESASDDGDGEGGGAEGGEQADDASSDNDAAASPVEAAEQAAAAAAGLDGARHAGQGRGSAPANNTSELLVPVTLPLPTDGEVLERVMSWKRARVHVAGKVRFGFTEQTIAGERDLATPKLPSLRVKAAQVAKADGGTGGEAYFTLLLENKNAFEVTAENLEWSISIAGKELKTKEGASATVPASSVEEYNETVELDEKAFPAKELKALLKQPAVPYKVEGFLVVKGIRHDFRFDGEMQFPR